MATIVKFNEYLFESMIFRTSKGGTLWVKSFENGMAVFDPMAGENLSDFATLVAGCFEEGSNVEEELQKAYNLDSDAKLTAIQFEFNGEVITVTKENADKDKIVDEYHRLCDISYERYLKEQEEYKKTPEYRAERAKELKEETRKQVIAERVIAVDESTELEFKDDEAKAKWEKFVEVNSDGYGSGCVNYARRWAKYMQMIMARDNKSVSQIASQTSHACDINSITGFMYGCAVSILSTCWKYGDELRLWHNKEWGYDGEDDGGVVNPAVLTLKVTG